MNDSDLQKLLRLKRYETPGDQYFDQFLSEFHQRQRSELLRRSSRSLFIERVTTWWQGTGNLGWIAGTSAAYAAIMAIILFAQNAVDEPKAEVVETLVPTLNQLFPVSHSPEVSPFKLSGNSAEFNSLNLSAPQRVNWSPSFGNLDDAIFEPVKFRNDREIVEF